MKSILIPFILILITSCAPIGASLSLEQYQATEAIVLTQTAPTARPLPSSTPPVSEEEAFYWFATSPTLEKYIATFNLFGMKHLEAANDISLMDNDQWIEEISIIMDDLVRYPTEISSFPQVPILYSDLHSAYVNLASETKLLVMAYSNTINSSAPYSFKLSIIHVGNIGTYVNDINTAIEALTPYD